MYNADSYFLAAANLLVCEDHGKQKGTGAILRNTLTASPSPVVTESIAVAAGPEYTGSAPSPAALVAATVNAD